LDDPAVERRHSTTEGTAVAVEQEAVESIARYARYGFCGDGIEIWVSPDGEFTAGPRMG
jgi:hypothetical protein